MKRRSDKPEDLDTLREKIIGLGERSIRKSYYPKLQEQLDALRLSEARFRNLFEQSSISMQILSPEGVTLEVNRAWETLWGLPFSALNGYNILNDRQLEGKGLMPYIRKGFSGEATEIPKAMYDPAEIGLPGRPRWVKAFIYPVKDENSRIRQVVLMHMDITEQAKAEEEIARSNRELEQFAYAVSHDLQAPLRSIAGFIDLLNEKYRGRIDVDADRLMDFIVKGAERMHRMIREILEYSRAGTQAAAREPVDLEEKLRQAQENLRANIEEKAAIITHDPLPTVFAEPTRMVTLLQNLIGNAIKFSSEAPRIHVAASLAGKEWVFSVKDNGIGIAPQHLERIFTLFQRLHAAKEYPGDGVGLALCKRIVERHSGRIWVESAPGRGSTFFFSLPANPQGEP